MNYELYLKNCPCGSQKRFDVCCKPKELHNIIQSPQDKETNSRPDWRIATIIQTAEDVKAAFEGGPAHPKGSYLSVIHHSEHPTHGRLGFITPHSSALSLNISVKCASTATELKKSLVLSETLAPEEKSKTINPSDILFDYFEQSMASVNFAFQSLESFCNSIIYTATQDKFELSRGGDTKKFSRDDVERKCSTEEKLSIILPLILKIKNPKGTQLWHNFTKLKDIRDSIVHMKSYDMYSHIKDDPNTLYYSLFDFYPLAYPKFAFEVIWYFSQTEVAKHTKPIWAQRFIDFFGKEIEKYY